MKSLLLILLASAPSTLLPAGPSAQNCGCDCCEGAKVCCCKLDAVADQPAAPVEQPKEHPVKGVVVALMPEKTALLVKHEAVPGVMRAMTMMFKVEPAVLEAVKQGDAIKGLMSRRADGWWLAGVEVTGK